MKSPILLVTMLFLFLGLAACGDTNNGLTSADVAYIRAKRIQELYGSSATTTVTSSTVVTVTATAVSGSVVTVY